MIDKEKDWDKLLQIKTDGRDDTKSDHYRFSYEPTPYSVLERLAESGLVGENDVILDYGCGKGRVGFFLSHQTKYRTEESNFTTEYTASQWKTRRPPSPEIRLILN